MSNLEQGPRGRTETIAIKESSDAVVIVTAVETNWIQRQAFIDLKEASRRIRREKRSEEFKGGFSIAAGVVIGIAGLIGIIDANPSSIFSGSTDVIKLVGGAFGIDLAVIIFYGARTYVDGAKLASRKLGKINEIKK